MKTSRRSGFSLLDKIIKLIEVTTPSDRILLRSLFFIAIFSGAWLVFSINQDFSTDTPIQGGTLTEGIIGTPRFINPALAITRADQDVTALIYSGLLKIDTEGNLVPDLAESITVSDDGLTYNIVVRRNISFHDGKPLTARDVVFTINLIQNPDLKSPLRGNWTDVIIEEINEYEINVVLEEAYAPFIENFLVGIMPAHLWSALPIEQIPFSQLNTEPIGSGPFKLQSATRDQSGLIKAYQLVAFRDNQTAPKINGININFYNDETAVLVALEKNLIQASAYVNNQSIDKLTESGKFQLITEPLPRSFGIFFNQNRSAALRDPAVREALSVAVDREALIEVALSGQGVPIVAPVTLNQVELELMNGSLEINSSPSLDRAKAILNTAGWRENNLGLLQKEIDGQIETLSITLRTSNVPLFDTTASILVEQWKAIGVEVTTEQFEQADLVQSVIRPRDFQALLFGLDMSRYEDLYPFWHSSQKDDPGLNISQYTNLTVDSLLESARTEQDNTIRYQALNQASELIVSENPSIFLFQPLMTYVATKDIIVSPIRNIGRPSDRFSNITSWYTDSDNLWPIFKREI